MIFCIRQNIIVTNIAIQNTGEMNFASLRCFSQYFSLMFIMSANSSYTLGSSTRGSSIEHKVCEWESNCLKECLLKHS